MEKGSSRKQRGHLQSAAALGKEGTVAVTPGLGLGAGRAGWPGFLKAPVMCLGSLSGD